MRNISPASIVLLLFGCNYTTTIQMAQIDRVADGGQFTVIAHLKKGELSKIQEKEFNYSLNLVECGVQQRPYPMSVIINGTAHSEAGENVGDTIIATGQLRILNAYKKPCVYISGGSMLFSKIKSNEVPLRP